MLQRLTKAPLIWGNFGRLYSSSSQHILQVDDPYRGDICFQTKWTTTDDLLKQKREAQVAQRAFAKSTTLQDRISVCQRLMGYFEQNKDEIATDISMQMGKPLSQAFGEIRGMRERVDALCEMSRLELENPIQRHPKDGFVREVIREPVGIVLTLAPWNYPLLTAVNSIVPAVLAGNGVLQSHGHRTPKISKHFESGFLAAGAPDGLVTAFTSQHDVTNRFIRCGGADFVSFTGSVLGGESVYESVGQVALFSNKVIDCTLELGGKDAAYVRSDADVSAAADTIADAAFYNAGQSCCSIERAYIQDSVYDEFVQKLVSHAEAYVLGDPLDSATSMGPMAQSSAVDLLRSQVKDAVSKGAQVLTGGEVFSDDGLGRFFLPTVIANCTPDMDVMQTESFGPILAIAAVSDDEQAVKLINDSVYGLTAAVFSSDIEKVREIGSDLQVGTVFANRADYLDPYLPWQGRKLSGKGCSLSTFGFHGFTKFKNLHLKHL